MRINRPRFLQPERETAFDYSCERSTYIRIQPSNGNQQANLNQASDIVFTYDGTNKLYRLADPESGFFVKIAFRTRENAPDNNANITLVNNWFGHLFSSVSFRIGSSEIEQYSDPGTTMDVLEHLKPREYRLSGGENSGFIPDTSPLSNPFLVSNPEITRSAEQMTNRSTVPRNLSNTNEDYNEGFRRRKNLYNYPVAIAAFRTVEAFIPLSTIFGCCEEDKCLKGINFEIKLTRKGREDFQDLFFGSAGTSVDFSNDANGGLLSLVLQIVEYIPNPELAPSIDEILKSKINWTFKKRKCIKRLSNVTEETISESTGTVPQYLFLVIKGTTDGAQQDGNFVRNFSLFRHARIQSVVADLDGVLYPAVEQNADFRNNCFSAFYEQFARACMILEGDSSAISAKEYRDLYPIVAINCGNKPLKAKNTTSNLSVRIKRKDLPANNDTLNDPLNVAYYLIGLYEENYEIDCTTKTVTRV